MSFMMLVLVVRLDGSLRRLSCLVLIIRLGFLLWMVLKRGFYMALKRLIELRRLNLGMKWCLLIGDLVVEWGGIGVGGSGNLPVVSVVGRVCCL